MNTKYSTQKNIINSANTLNSEKKPLLQGNIVKSSLKINNIQVNSQLSIYSLNGTLVKCTVANTNNQFEWNVNDLSQGVYLLSIQNQADSEKLKFIKE